MEISLKGKRALIGGASQGIGASIALEYASSGAKVTMLARNGDNLARLCNELPGDGHTFIAQDISDRESLAQQVKEELRKGGYDILICNTGGPKAGPIAAATASEFVAGFENHVLVNSMLSQLVLPHMREGGYGRIINIISTSVRIPIPNLGVSNTIRGAVASWAKTLSMEVAADGVTVNNILPGYTDTVRLEVLLKAWQEKTGKTWDEVVAEWKNRVPMKRFGRPEEIAALATFLASEHAGYVTGVSIPVDGGRTGAI